MKILMASPEMLPYAKVGGLGDMVGALTKALMGSGEDVRVVLPYYGSVRVPANFERWEKDLDVRVGNGEFAGVWEGVCPETGARIYLIENAKYYGRPEVYDGAWGEHEYSMERFVFLSRATLDICLATGWVPDVVHGHDWTVALISCYLEYVEKEGVLGDVASVFTIHNLLHQGVFEKKGKQLVEYARLPKLVLNKGVMGQGRGVNLMKGALRCATKLTAVSRHYAEEIQGKAMGCGLDKLIRARNGDLVGITNGIDAEVWNPKKDRMIPEKFSFKDLSGKAVCKEWIQDHFELDVVSGEPLFAVVARLDYQKGLDVLAKVMGKFLKGTGAQFILLGSGDLKLEKAYRKLAKKFPGRVGVEFSYSEPLAHGIEAGADFFVMPSRFEPCGLNQMYSMAYGTVPIARATGGLVDTVKPLLDGVDAATGFLFEDLSPKVLLGELLEAYRLYRESPEVYRGLQVNGMREDFSWEKSVKEYLRVYREAVGFGCQVAVG